MSLTLLGTVHCDPDGFSRSLLFFEHYRPDLILVEISDFAVAFREKRSPELRKLFLERLSSVTQKLSLDLATALAHPQIASILWQISLPFEYSASLAYARRCGVPLVPVDYSGFSRKWIKTWKQMISSANIETLLSLDNFSPPVFSLYARAAQRIYEEKTFPETQPADGRLWQERENRMSANITAALNRFGPERPVYIGGWWHLCRGENIATLRDLQGVPGASCLLLDRA
ncbi:MAG: hypothetical protein P4L43_11100 [Syntrophobacteraceae bacterium]|nr:hypothetical protein [Syntrophobacteraceae bacterium]